MIWRGAAFFVIALCVLAQTHPYRSTFENYASSIQTFDTVNFAYDRSLKDRYCGDTCEAAVKFQDYLKANQLDPIGLQALLRHADPKVRTLAMAALFDLEDPRFLPDFFSLLSDSAMSFPALEPIHRLPGMNLPGPMTTQTVGQIARKFLSFYLDPAGYYYPAEGASGQPGFKEYWQAYKDSAYSASWFQVKLARAGQRTSPSPADRIGKIKRLRQEIDRIPPTDRAWILLFLHSEAGSGHLVADDDLVAQLKRAGRANLLRLLRKESISSDPALRSRPSNNYSYHAMCIFVLQHAAGLLSPQDAEMLLERERWERRYLEFNISDPLISGWWAIAAARLRPSQADSILTDALPRFKDDHLREDRVNLAVALWRLVGEPRRPFLVDRLLGGESSSAFFNQLRESPAQQDISLLKALANDSRLERLSWRSLEALVRLANAHHPKPLVTLEEFGDAWHPDGFELSYSDLPEARRQFPKETQALLAKMAQWRQRFKAAFGPAL